MKISRVRVLLLVVALVSVVVLPTFSLAADDGATVFKSKCAGCHGPNGEGKPAMKAPALKGTSLTSDQIVDMVTKGAAGKKAPHTKGVSGLTDEQAKAVAEYVKTLK